MKEVLKVDKVNKYFGKKHVVKDLSFTMNEGDILAFIGPNGAGKTTTIKLILQLQSLSSGKVYINGFDNQKDFEKALSGVGAIVESPDMYMYLTGLENLKLAGNLYPGITSADYDRVLDLVGLKSVKDMKVSKYSLGMRQRLGIAAALLSDPNVLIFDEPTNGLDPEGIRSIRELFKKLAREGKAILISSHNLGELENFCTKVCIIKKGELITEETVSDLKKRLNNKTYCLETEDLDKAKAILNGNVVDNKIEFLLEDSLNHYLEKLLNEKIRINAIYEKDISLEDAFMDVAGGNKID